MWNRPKKTLKVVATSLAVVSMIMAVCWLLFAYIWIKQPEKIQQLDAEIPDYYQQTLEEYKERILTANTRDKQNKAIWDFMDEFKNMNSLYNGYEFLVESFVILIDNHIKQGKTEEAIKIAKNWQEKHPFEFRAKFKYYQLLLDSDLKAAITYIKEVYELYPDVIEVSDRYVTALLADHQYQAALNIAVQQKEDFFDNGTIRFMVFYKDKKHKKYHRNTKVILPYSDVSQVNDGYQVKMTKTIDQLNGLRLDVDWAYPGSVISNIDFSIQTQESLFEDLDFKPLSQLEEIDEKVYRTKGTDPYFEVIIPPELKGYEDEFTFYANLKVESSAEFSVNRILNHPEWQLFYSTTGSFNEENSLKPTVTYDRIEDSLALEFEETLSGDDYRSMRIDLPSLIDLNLNEVILNINADLELTADDISAHPGIETTGKGLRVISSDPYMIFHLDQGTQIDTLKVRMELGGEK